MRVYAPLLLALLVSTHAASIPDALQPELEKKLVIDDEKPPAEDISIEPQLLDPASAVIDVENKLRNQLKLEDIPVKVVVEELQPAIKSAQLEPTYEVVEEEIKRPVIDLRNPGPPQHQEHETQNPEHHEDAERKVYSVKGEIQESKVALRQAFRGVTNGLQNWHANSEQINILQNSINSLQESFSSQLQKLNDTLQNFLKPNSKPLTLEDEKVTKTKIENIETGLKTLESNFQSGVQSLSEGVQLVATLKEEGGADGADSASTVAPGSQFNPIGFVVDAISNMQNILTSGFSNMSNAINNLINPNQVPILSNVQNIFQPSTSPTPLADTPVTSPTTSQPSAWENLQSSITNILNPNQNAQNNQPAQAPSGPFVLPAFPIITGIVNLIQRPGTQSTVKPSVEPLSDPVPATTVPSNPAPVGSNAVPTPVNPEEINIKPEPENKPEAPVNPIRKIVENNPIVQGINGAVQRILAANSPDKPRDTVDADAVNSDEIKSEDVKVEEEKMEEVKHEQVVQGEVKPDVEKDEAEKVEVEQEKGGLFLLPPKPHGHPGSGVDSNSGLDTPSEETQKVSENTSTEQVSDKTE